ncbi:MAG TPA: ABC transporter substrate-binding protein/permease [Gemmatimonadaceae bacterium]|nr:ABC transporter substrate-binding protein/permease [Gemmatimonadaceae bacterium]
MAGVRDALLTMMDCRRAARALLVPVVRSARTVACRVTVLALAMTLAGCGRPSTPTDGERTTVLRWGGDAEGGAPYVEADPAHPDSMRGFDVEIAEMIAKGLGRTPRFVQVAFASIDASVERGDFDVGLSGVEDRPELHERHSPSLPYFEFREVLAVRVADSARYRSLDDLAGRRVGTLGATLAYRMLLAEQSRTGLVAVSYDDDVHPYTDLVEGRLDAVLLDHIIAERSFKRIGGFRIQPDAFARGHYIAIFAKGDSALRDSANAVLRARMRDGSLEATFRRWDVWDAEQAALFQRVLADSAATRPEPSTASASSIARYIPALLRGAGLTLVLSCLAMLLAVSLGVAIAAGRVYGPPAVRLLLTAYVEVMRGTPVLLQLFVLYYGLSGVVRLPAFLAAVIGLGLNYAAYESEIYRSALMSIAPLQLEAARTLGLSELQVLRLVRGPQAFRLALAPMTNDFVALLKDSSLVSVITVVELTKQTAIYATNIGSWFIPGVLCGALYLALSLPLSRAARSLERRWSPR